MCMVSIAEANKNIKILEVDASNLSRAFAAALVALAEVPEDALSRIALQTLCEIGTLR